ncbi:ABC transporter ATP-binding protein [Balneola sp. MJW-20]|uniref:ABC transporter ATP-binding protein n=1 Tax=Gracilimonas aurantiaca TaxID=3234185 RepID=UPI003465690B
MNKAAVLNATDLYKTFPGNSEHGELKVLQGVSLDLYPAEITSIVGSSGSGKSTLLHILGGLDSADSGHVYWNDKDISGMSQDKIADLRNKNIGFVFQFHHLLPEFTAQENVAMPAMIGGQSSDEAMRKALFLLERFGIEDRRDHRPAQLSGGEQQRVSMARALVNDPRVILADEPTGNLDDKNTKVILDLLFELTQTDDLSVLLITHEMDIADRSDRIMELKNGVLHPH